MLKKATFGAGCFWGVEAHFLKLNGVVDALSGYMGGQTDNPTYEDVCTDLTGHAEVVEVEFDPELISYQKLLEEFFSIHNPTTRNRQGLDVGSQYRSVIFYYDDEQKNVAEDMTCQLNEQKKYSDPIVTEISPATKFYKAEEYHQRYYQKKGISSCGL